MPDWMQQPVGDELSGRREAVTVPWLPDWLPDWLLRAFTNDSKLDWRTLVTQLTFAFVLGCVAVAVHRLSSGPVNRRANGPLRATLVLLAVLISLVTVVIGSNVARAFSLVGALAIVRFRTVVEDTRDTAFVIYAVVMGMAVGTGYGKEAIACTPFVVLTAWLFRSRPEVSAPPEAILVLRLAAGLPPDERIQAVLSTRLKRYRITGLETARGGAALDVTYTVELSGPEQAFGLVGDLTRVEGVQGVELKRL